MRNLLVTLLCCICLCACTKPDVLKKENTAQQFIQYNILTGKHFCNESVIKPLKISSLQFKVVFDSSALYTSRLPENQFDINKLYGFSEGNDHHKQSARIGWAYNEGFLRLYAYAYNDAELLYEEISPIKIGDTINCSINVENRNYVFVVNNISTRLPRASDSLVAEGYQLYPYFGGDETAPHPIRIFIAE